MNGFEDVKTETLLKIRKNLLKGIDEVAKAIDKGEFHKIGPKGEAPPSQSGNLTLALLKNIDEVLKTRK